MNEDFVIEARYNLQGLKKYKGKDEVVTIPEEINYIEERAFYGNKTVKKVILPDHYVSIEREAFMDCEDLESINLKENITIYRDVFLGCKKLGDENGLVVVDGRVYGRTVDKEELKITEGVRFIQSHVFAGIDNLKSIEIADSVIEIDTFAFSGCKNLEYVKLPKNIKEIANYVFYNDVSLKQVTIPDKVKVIDMVAFSGCENLEDVYIQSDKIKIDKRAFSGSPKVRIHCSKPVIKKQPKEIQALWVSDTRPEDKVGLFYNRLRGLDVERMIADVSKKFTWEKPVYPKPCKVSFEKDGKTMEVECKLATSLRSAKREIGENRVYDAYDAADHMLSKEEVLALIEEMDPNGHSDAFMFARPEIGPDATVLSEEEYKKRFFFFTYLAYKIADEEVLKQIAEEMPKKKNGTFAKNRIQRLASSCCALSKYGDDYILEIVAKPTSDTKLTISAVLRSMSVEEVFLLEEDFVSTHPEIFNLGAYYSEEIKAPEKPEREEHQEAIPEETEPVAPVDPKEQIREIMAAPLDEEQQAQKDAWLADYGENLDRDPQVEFKNHAFAFTGIEDVKESPLVKLIEKKGGVVRTKVSGKTNYLIVDPVYAGISKVENVLAYIEEGKEMKIILLEDLFPLL